MNMTHFVVNYQSDGNCSFNGSLHITAASIEDAQDKFLDWLKQQEVYGHLWQLQFEFVELNGSLNG